MACRMLLVILLLSSWKYPFLQSCEDSQPVDIVDLTTRRLHLIIENALNDDLSDPGQGVCGVAIEFDHEFIGDLRMILSSPGGDSVTLIGPTGQFGFSNFTQWAITFLPCGIPVSPDPGFADQWSNEQDWGLFGNYTGTYYAELGCLEDFDSGPVNGIWTLTIEDGLMFNDGSVAGFSIIFCDESGLGCQQCNAEGGVLNTPDTLSFCLNDSALDLELDPFENIDPPDTSQYEYIFTYSTNDTVRGIMNSTDFRDFPIGEYMVCGISFLVDSVFDSDEFLIGLSNQELFTESHKANPDHCIARSEECVVIQISQLPDINAQDVDLQTCSDTLLRNVEIMPVSSDVTWFAPNGLIFRNDEILTDSVPRFGEWKIIASNNSCRDSAFFNTTVRGIIPSVEIAEPDTLTCQNLEVALNVQSNIENPDYLWLGPGSYESELEAPVANKPGNYHLILSFYDTCTTGANVNIHSTQVFPQIELDADTADCQNQQVHLSVGTPDSGVSFLWTGPGNFSQMDSMVTVETPGRYYLEATNQEGCITVDSIEAVFDLNLPVIDSLLTDTLSCMETEVQIGVYASDNNLIYSWTGPADFGSDEPFPLVTMPGEYFLNLTNIEGCGTDASVIVAQEGEVPVIRVFPDTINCDSPEVILIAETEDEYLSVDWEGPNGFSSTELMPTVTEGGEYVLQLEGVNGCVATAIVHIGVDTIRPQIQLNEGYLPCDGRLYMLPASSTDSNLTIQWNGPDGFASNELSPFVNIPGMYHVSVEFPNGCETTDSLLIRDEPVYPAYVSSGDTINCEVSMVDLEVEILDEFEEFQWTGPDSFSSENTQITASTPGIYHFEIVGGNGCVVSDSVLLEADTLRPQIQFDSFDPLLCEKTMTQLHAENSTNGPDYRIFWSTLDGLIDDGINSLSPLVSGPGTYKLTIEDQSNHCFSNDSLVIQIAESPLTGVEFSTIGESCIDSGDGRLIIEEVFGDQESYFYSPNGLYETQDDTLRDLFPGDYTLTIRDSFGCVLDTTFFIAQGSEFEISLEPEYSAILGDTLIIRPEIIDETGGEVILEWQIDNTPFQVIDLSVAISPLSDLEFSVIGINSAGCFREASSRISVSISESFFAPNIFRPNSANQINDVFRIFPGLSVAFIEEFRVFDRWGNELYSRENIMPGDSDYGWDGRYRGELLQPAVYVYISTLVFFNGEKRQIKGSVTLLR